MTDGNGENAPRPGGGFWRVVWRECGRIAVTPFYLLFVFIFPLTMLGILAISLSEASPRKMPIVVCDGDNSDLSRRLTRMFAASSSLNVMDISDSMEEAQAVMRLGRAYSIAYIPPDFEREVGRGNAPSVELYGNTQWLLTSGVIAKALREVTTALSLEVDTRTRMEQGELPGTARAHADPILMEQHILFNPCLSYKDFLVPPLFIGVLQIFVIVVMVSAIGSELKNGTAGAWLEASGGRSAWALLGKMAPYTALFLLVMACAMVWAYNYQGIPFQGNPWLTAWGAVLYILAYQSMGFTFVVTTANYRLAASLSGFYAGPAFAFSGFTFPSIGMPAAAKVWSAILPLNYFGHFLLNQASRGASPASAHFDLIVLTGFAALPIALLFPRFGRLLRDEKYWGRM